MQLTPLRPRRRRTSAQIAGYKRHAATPKNADLVAVAERIASLNDGPVTEALVGILTELYGDALKRIVAAVSDAPAGEAILDQLCDDGLVGGLLVVHDLHPLPLEARVERALAGVERMTAHPAAPALDRIEDDVVYVRLARAAGPAVRAAISRAIVEAAPEISRVCAEVEAGEDTTLHF